MPEISHEIGTQRDAGLLLKTGQTTQYGGYEDDGYFEKGLSKRYTVLTTGRYAGTTDITLNAKTDAHSNNCVLDQRTKLMWSRYVAGSVGPASDGKLPWTTNVNDEGIFDYADAANAAKLAGYSDWRVPNNKELESLTNEEGTTAAPDTTAFPSWPTADPCWSSTTPPYSTGYAQSISYLEPYIYPLIKTQNHNTALVRGGQ